MNKTDGTSIEGFSAPSGSPSSRPSPIASKCAVLTPPLGHPQRTNVDEVVVANCKSNRSSHSRWTTCGLACSKPIAEGVDECTPECQQIHWGLWE